MGAIWALAGVDLAVVVGQRPQFSQPLPTSQANPAGSGSRITAPSLTPVPPSAAPPLLNTTPGAAAAGSGFDPYSTAPGPVENAPSLLSPPPSTPYYDPSNPGSLTGSGLAPGPVAPGDPGLGGGGATLPANPYGGPVYPPAEPGYAFPNGMGDNFMGGFDVERWLCNPEPGRYVRVLQDFRLRHTWITGGDSPDDLQIHDFEFATTLNYRNFLFSQQPLQVSSGFILHLWDGPKRTLADLPGNAYSAYLNFGWQPQITPRIGAILNTRVGVFSDFDTFNNNSIRILGQGLVVLGLTPRLAIKGGIEYLDRLRIKILPAGGVLWTPNERMRFDIYFPRPKFAYQTFVLGNRTVWWYVGGEYGGGSWTIQRSARLGFSSDQVDINDLRVFTGFEWIDNFGLAGFIEVGYVFERELIYRVNPADNLDLNSAFMLRSGFSF